MLALLQSTHQARSRDFSSSIRIRGPHHCRGLRFVSTLELRSRIAELERSNTSLKEECREMSRRMIEAANLITELKDESDSR